MHALSYIGYSDPPIPLHNIPNCSADLRTGALAGSLQCGDNAVRNRKIRVAAYSKVVRRTVARYVFHHVICVAEYLQHGAKLGCFQSVSVIGGDLQVLSTPARSTQSDRFWRGGYKLMNRRSGFASSAPAQQIEKQGRGDVLVSMTSSIISTTAGGRLVRR